MGRGRRGVPQVSHQAPSAGYFLGPLIFPQEPAKAAFSSRFVPACLFIESAFSSLWLEDQHAAVQQDWSPGVSSLATWKSGNRRFFLSSPQQIRRRRGLFRKQGADLGTLVPRSVARTPCWPPGPAWLARAPLPAVSSRSTRELELPSLPPRPGLT